MTAAFSPSVSNWMLALPASDDVPAPSGTAIVRGSAEAPVSGTVSGIGARAGWTGGSATAPSTCATSCWPETSASGAAAVPPPTRDDPASPRLSSIVAATAPDGRNPAASRHIAGRSPPRRMGRSPFGAAHATNQILPTVALCARPPRPAWAGIAPRVLASRVHIPAKTRNIRPTARIACTRSPSRAANCHKCPDSRPTPQRFALRRAL
jgi:hypothetical protein